MALNLGIRCDHHSKILFEVFWFEPPNFLVSGPQLAGLIDVNLTGLLGIRLPEFLANPQGVETSFKDAAFAAEISRTRKAKCCRETHFGWIEDMAIRVVAQIEHLAFPIGL